MMNEKELKRTGKYVSMLLRHHPEEAGVILDEHGWTDVQDLIEKVSCFLQALFAESCKIKM